ncbi:hypothetical protein TNIN_438781 [Trichonephila inaurata madagascariensis]|uniref:Uncharacterized protein n=1 Tax=Trichonephila inaurata madagascariensis TaxID=2747483 RepID=A0A8X6IBM8_9ARAC|nr:hypothetical protein TNIN_438781 [Trichonephila inaurata madagascariensis]
MYQAFEQPLEEQLRKSENDDSHSGPTLHFKAPCGFGSETLCLNDEENIPSLLVAVHIIRRIFRLGAFSSALTPRLPQMIRETLKLFWLTESPLLSHGVFLPTPTDATQFRRETLRL